MWSNQDENQLTFPPGATTGARMVINADGITIYNADNNIILQIEAPPGAQQGLIDFFYDPILHETPGYITYSDAPSIFPVNFYLRLDQSILDQLALYTNDGAGHVRIAWATDKNGLVSIPKLHVGPPAGDPLTSGTSFQFGSGLAGAYYYEEASIASGAAIAAGWNNPALTSTDLLSDYGGSQFAGNVWTAPDNGIYQIQFQATCNAANSAANERYIWRISGAAGGGGNIYANSEDFIAALAVSHPSDSLNCQKEFAAGALLSFGFFYGGGTNNFDAFSGVTIRRVV